MADLDMRRPADWARILKIAVETEDWSLAEELAQHMRIVPDAVTTDEVYAWHVGRFGEPDVALVGLKLAEEAGEVAGALVKRAEGAVRPAKGLVDYGDWTAHLHGEIGDIGIVLNVLAGREGVPLDELIARRFRDDVSRRTGQEHSRRTNDEAVEET